MTRKQFILTLEGVNKTFDGFKSHHGFELLYGCGRVAGDYWPERRR